MDRFCWGSDGILHLDSRYLSTYSFLFFFKHLEPLFNQQKSHQTRWQSWEHDSKAPSIQRKHTIPSLVSNSKALILQLGFVHCTFKRRTRAYRYPPFGRCLSIHFCQVSYKLSIFPSNLLLFLFPVLFCFVFFGCV
jgi:hypothetical protein